jgi:Tol biopolymer transport system component
MIPPRMLILLVFLWAGCSDSGPLGTAVGDLRVTLTTLGQDVDPDGYGLVINGGIEQPVGINETVTLQGLEEGTHKLELTGIADNCETTDNPRNVTVGRGGTATAHFQVTCVPWEAPIVPGQIAFSSDRNGNWDIYILRAGVATQLTNDPAWDGVPAISPDGTRILFESKREDPEGDIYVMNTDGSGVTNLTRHPGADERPSWSPDGSRILFVSGRTGNLDVFVMKADGSDPVNLTNHPAVDRPAAWSPDGTRIAFSSDRTGDFEIFVMDVDGSEPVNVTNDPDRVDFAPAWSPDGQRIAYTSRTGVEAFTDILVMNADGTGRMNLTNTTAVDERGPSWSPDGTQIVFGLSRQPGPTQVYIMNGDGSALKNVSQLPGVPGWPQAWSLLP